MTLLAMVAKKMSKTTTDIAMETVGTVRRVDMTMETVDMVTETMDMAMETVDTDTETMDMVKETVDTVTMVDMAMETVIMVTVKVDTNTETMDMVMEMVDMAMAKMDMEEVKDIQTIQAQLTVIKVIPRVTHQDPRTVQKATADTNDYFNQTSDF